MTQDSSYTDHSDIELKVTLTSGEANDQPLKCFLLRTYTQQLSQIYACDAHALIYFYEINGLRDGGSRIDYHDYSMFCDDQDRVWNIDSFKENSPPEAPGLIFQLKKQDFLQL